MSYLDRVRTCRRWDPAGYRPFRIGARDFGRVAHDFAERLRAFPEVFQVENGAVALAPGLDEVARRTAAVRAALLALRAQGAVPRWRDEDYPVVRRWGDPPALALERAAVPLFGVRGFGVHLNGFVRRDDGLQLWVGRRARNKATAPGKLDHLVAGGQPCGLGIRENLIKECAEEAGIPVELAERAVATGAVSYRCVREEGLRDDVLFCFDLELPAEFEPKNTDGEVEAFFLWPIEEVLARIAETDDFKFNVALVILDFALRHGLIGPDMPDYQAIWEGLHLGAEA